MYLWVVIAIFISALAALSSSLRPDIKEVYFNTQAETEATQIYTLHRAVLKYYTYHNKVEGEVDYDQIAGGYLPFGFNRGNFHSELYCLTEDGTSLPGNCAHNVPVDEDDLPEDGCGVDHSCVGVPNYHQDDQGKWYYVDSTGCCQQTGASAYLITYGPVSVKWQDARTGKPRAEILDSMKNKLGYVDGLGYSVDNHRDEPYMGTNNVFNTLGSEKGVVCQGSKPYYSIPQYIINNNANFNGHGACAGDGNYCLVYITKI